MNKQGGAAFIVSANSEDNSYDVRYVLDKTNDLHVPMAFVVESVPLESRRRRSRGLADVTDCGAFDSTVTHCAVSIKDGVVMQRTMKYMQAIMAGLWIVSDMWMLDSLQENRILAEKSYEIVKNVKSSIDDAPRRARESIAKALYSVPHSSSSSTSLASAYSNQLFSCYRVHLFGSFPHPGPASSHLSELLIAGNGCLVASLKEFLLSSPKSPIRHRVIVLADTTAKEDALCAIAEITSDVKKTCGDICFVTMVWILDSVANFKTANPSDYQI